MRRVLFALALAAPICLAVIVSARGAEAITNGNFEGGGTGWTAQLAAGFCTTASCPGGAARGGTGWASIGGGTSSSPGENKVGQISQDVTIPSAPATLTVYMRYRPGSAASALDRFRVFLDNNQELKVVDPTGGGYGSYTLVTVDLSPYAGTHTIKLHGQAFANTGNTFAIFDIDDVSLTVPDPPSTSTSTSTTSTTSTTPETTTTTTTTTTTPTDPANPATCAGKTATITGTDGTEIVTGTPSADVIAALDGDDVVRAGAGNDIVCGGGGNDELKGASGKDQLLGETGRDKLNGGGGDGDRCDGGPSRDKATQSCEKAKRL